MESKTHSTQSSWSARPPPGSPAPPYVPLSPFSSPGSTSPVSPSAPFPLPLPLPTAWQSLSRYVRKRRAGLLPLLAGVLLVAVSFLFLTIVRTECKPVIQVVQQGGVRSDAKFSVRNWVLGAPKTRLTENLKPDVKYISTFVSSGWTNDVMTYGNMLYLALLTQRVPILGPFVPSHLQASAGYIPFGDVFDIPRMARDMNWPLLEWSDVKDADRGVQEEVGCWSAWMGTSRTITEPKSSWVTSVFGLDVSYTAVPYDRKMYPENDQEPHLLHGKLMELGFPTGRQKALSQSTPRATSQGNALEPSDQLLCFDQMYAVSVDTPWEWFTDSSPVWRFVGKHMRWNPNAEALAQAYLAQHWGLAKGEPIPPYISVHIRRGDFGDKCKYLGKNGTGCLPTTNQLKRRVGEVQTQLLEKGISTDKVLITSDEKDPAWWEEIQQAGYTWIDHVAAQTDTRYGEWYSPLLDAIFHSSGAGFVGTDSSTMSMLAARRVAEWNDGPSAFLQWINVPEEEL
ncbi:hypothetical protein CALVIDRAFT_354484 [Calocera viscosa TUFC12733]|uniref:Uncharacterized protein n=1 Tax=Calocera viscosa (strain TUFC12733) TaxID=1330018 RepID=A0A167QCU3_CALVF|nr:hypothetical protein CALVIDRAFT_354484 [Calocera viscosa TUFC12733]